MRADANQWLSVNAAPSVTVTSITCIPYRRRETLRNLPGNWRVSFSGWKCALTDNDLLWKAWTDYVTVSRNGRHWSYFQAPW